MSKMKEICKNKAFSQTGECLMGDDCICKANEKWINQPDEEDATPSPKDQPEGQSVLLFVKERIEGLENATKSWGPSYDKYFNEGQIHALKSILPLLGLETSSPASEAGMSQEAYDRQERQGEIPEEIRKWMLSWLEDHCEDQKEFGAASMGLSAMYHKMQEEIAIYKNMWKIADKTMNELRLKVQELNKITNG